MPNMSLKKNPMPHQDPKVRARNFDEVALGYTPEQAMALLRESDARFDARIDRAAEYVIAKGAEFLCLSGPSCAGKTTTAIKLTARLAKQGIGATVVSLDDFFYDMDYLLKMSAEKGTALDMDSADTIDLACFAECLQGFVAHKPVQVPIFDFHTHCRSGYRTLTHKKGDLIIFEGIQAIYPEVTALIKPYGMASIFACPDQAITVGEQIFEPNIYRFYRRIVRDAQYRSADANRTLEVWRGVRNNEDAHIFPLRDSFEHVVDTSMGYDLHVLTPYLRELLPQVSEQSRFYLRAVDILNRISCIQPIPAKYLPTDSLYREFIQF